MGRRKAPMAVVRRPGPKPPNDALTAVARKKVMYGILSSSTEASGSRMRSAAIGATLRLRTLPGA